MPVLDIVKSKLAYGITKKLILMGHVLVINTLESLFFVYRLSVLITGHEIFTWNLPGTIS